jgi:hypothetical protein
MISSNKGVIQAQDAMMDVCFAGHYVSYVQVQGKWFYFDDAQVELASQSDVEGTFGQASDWSFGNDSHAYLLFYQLIDRGSHAGTASNPSETAESSDGPGITTTDATKIGGDSPRLHDPTTDPV